MLKGNQTHNHGNVQVTPGVMTAPATLLTDPNNIGDDTTGLSVSFSPSGPAVGAVSALTVVDKDGSTKVMEVFENYIGVYNRALGCSPGVFNTPASLNGTVSPVCVQLADGARIWQGTGAPGTAFTGTGRVGDIYLRRDGAAGTYYYICTTAGTPGTWSALA